MVRLQRVWAWWRLEGSVGRPVIVGVGVLRTLRLARALELLRQTSLPVGLVAERLGYRDGAELARACRRAHGASPSQLRNGR